VSLISASMLRRLIPAGAVAAVLVASYLAPLNTLASNLNNCGVKGYGYHDHGKVCPNRPFPGRGVGLAKFGITLTSTNPLNISVGHNKKGAHTTSEPTPAMSTGDASLDTTTGGKGHHGHDNGEGRGERHNNM
jgi:hypothetical protein